MLCTDSQKKERTCITVITRSFFNGKMADENASPKSNSSNNNADYNKIPVTGSGFGRRPAGGNVKAIIRHVDLCFANHSLTLY